jgi:carbon starvation protein CstA
MEPIQAIALVVSVCVLLLYVFFWFILPVLWKYLLRPLGKLAYFLLLVILGISFFAIFFVGKQLGIPEDVQLMMAIFSAVVSGVKWASKRR